MKKKTKKVVFSVCGIGVAVCVGLSLLGSAASSKEKANDSGSRGSSSSSWLANSSTTSGAYDDYGYYEEISGEEYFYEASPNASASENYAIAEEEGWYDEYEEAAYDSSTTSLSVASTNSKTGDASDFDWQEGSSGVDLEAQTTTDARKLIKTVSMTVETLTFDDFLAGIQDRTYAYGGYVDELETWNNSKNSKEKNLRDAYLILKIPSKDLVAFNNEIGQNCNILSKCEEVNDVTSQYTNYESRKTVLLAEEERLLSFMEQAETIDEIMKIEARLTEVQSEIDAIESSLRTYDNLVSYSTVKVQIKEVSELTEEPEEPKEKEEKEPTFGELMKANVKTSVDNLVEGVKCVALWFARNVVLLSIIVVIVLVIIIKAKLAKKKKGVHSKKQENLLQNSSEKSTMKNAPVNQSAMENAPVNQSTKENASVNQSAMENAPVNQSTKENVPVIQSTKEYAPVNQTAMEKSPVEK